VATKSNGNGSRQRHRRRMILLLVVALALLAWLVWGMVTDLRGAPVDYKVQSIAPAVRYLCPGDTLRYPVVLEVSETPVILTIVESWCRAGTAGVCSRDLTTVYQVPVLKPKHIEATAVRVVPESSFFRPGDEIEFQHATTAGETITGYVAGPIVIRSDCESTR